MIPAAFDYVAPSSLDQAIALLQQHGDDAKILAGGHSLLPLMKLRLAQPAVLVDLAQIPDLHYIRATDTQVAIGAMTPYVDLEDSVDIRQRLPLLAQTASMVGDAQVRNRGTLGGAAAHADPAGDMPVVLTALGAIMVARGADGEREIGADDFFEDIFTSALQPDEILVEIRVPVSAGAHGNYQKFRRRMIDWAIVGVAANITRQNGSIDRASVVLTNVGPRPMRAATVERALHGQPATVESVEAAAESAADGLDPSPEIHASPEYKRRLARVLTRRALLAALKLEE